MIKIDDSFDLQKIIDSGQCFRPKRLTNGEYRFIYRENILDIKRISDDKYEISCSKDEWDNIWHHYFDLATDYDSIIKSIPSCDNYMRNASKLSQGIRILNQDKWEMLISFIISQRKSIPAIRSSVEKLCTLYGNPLALNGETIYSFPTPSQMKDASKEELDSCGMGYRSEYILNAVEKVNSGEIDLEKIDKLPNDELDEVLKSIRGVGNKVSNCVMLFGYHRVDRVPVDTWIARVINDEYAGENPFDRYGKYAGIMQQYVFYAARSYADSIR